MAARPSFRKVVEDFVCGRCGFAVRGRGYTNHCPKCLWSRHVDVNPGDRAAECGGMMEPVRVETDGDGYSLVHRCGTCGHEKRNKTAADDDFGEILAIAKKSSDRFGG